MHETFYLIAHWIDGDPVSSRVVGMDITRGAYLLPVGFASPYWFVMNHRLRFQ